VRSVTLNLKVLACTKDSTDWVVKYGKGRRLSPISAVVIIIIIIIGNTTLF
jgi:hypothetical protein